LPPHLVHLLPRIPAGWAGYREKVTDALAMLGQPPCESSLAADWERDLFRLLMRCAPLPIPKGGTNVVKQPDVGVWQLVGDEWRIRNATPSDSAIPWNVTNRVMLLSDKSMAFVLVVVTCGFDCGRSGSYRLIPKSGRWRLISAYFYQPTSFGNPDARSSDASRLPPSQRFFPPRHVHKKRHSASTGG
jgi:hypothetical protein